MIYFTSDLHLGHRSALHKYRRPFKDVNEMNETIIRNWNNLVQDEDTVYILGDVSNHIGNTRANDLIARLKGHKILILGNHDSKGERCKYNPSLFEEICAYKRIEVNGKVYVLFHYPIEYPNWEKYRYGARHLHGHVHSRPNYNQRMKDKKVLRYDVGVDANGYTPISINEIEKFFAEEPS